MSFIDLAYYTGYTDRAYADGAYLDGAYIDRA